MKEPDKAIELINTLSDFELETKLYMFLGIIIKFMPAFINDFKSVTERNLEQNIQDAYNLILRYK